MQMLVLKQASRYHCGKRHDQFDYLKVIISVLGHAVVFIIRHHGNVKKDFQCHSQSSRSEACFGSGLVDHALLLFLLIWPGLYNVSKAEVTLIFIDHSRLSLALPLTVICFLGIFLSQGGLISLLYSCNHDWKASVSTPNHKSIRFLFACSLNLPASLSGSSPTLLIVHYVIVFLILLSIESWPKIVTLLHNKAWAH